MRTVIASSLLLAACGLRAGPRPVKLDIQAARYGLRAGEPLPVRLRLLDSANQPAPAPNRLDVLMQARLPSGDVKSLQTVTLQPGESEKAAAVTPPGTGMIYLWAKQAELLPGGVFVAVRTENVPLTPVNPAAPRVSLRYSPDRRFLADGKDAATVQAFLLNEAAGADIRLNLFDSSGTLKPVPLIIPKGQDSGRASLNFSQPGTVTVEFMGSEPPAEVEGDGKLEIPFMPAITHVALESSPPAISLVDKADLVLTFRDDRERPVASDVVRHVTLAIAGGRGQLAQGELEIAAGQFEARTSFQPEWLGRAEISAATPNLLTVSVPVQVGAPLALLLCSLAGGLVGGYFCYLKRKRSGRRQIGIGAVTGFLFYWACLFLGLAAIGHAAVVNPMSAFALSTFGGWLQTGVFAFWKSRLKAGAG